MCSITGLRCVKYRVSEAFYKAMGPGIYGVEKRMQWDAWNYLGYA